MDFRLLGPLEVRDDDRVLTLGAAKQRALLTTLLLHANEVVSVEQLIEELWGDERPPTAENTLQAYVSRLRKTLGGNRIRTSPPGYITEVEPEELDVARFELLAREGKQALARGEASLALSVLQQALALWRGSPLAELSHSSSAQIAIARLEEEHLSALENRLAAELAVGRHAETIGELTALSAQHPLRERLRGQLMLALYRAGRQADALEIYRQTREFLVEELGLEPSRKLQQLQSRILVHDPGLDARPSRSDSGSPDTLYIAGKPPAIRKSVTVVSAAVQFDERLDPEALGRVRSTALDALSDAFARHGGSVEKRLGEGLVGIFGVPRVHEDDALRAVRAASQAQEAVSDAFASEPATNLCAVRIGIDTGEVVACAEGDLEGHVVGDAASMSSLARDGEILVGRRTRALLPPEVIVRRTRRHGSWRLVNVDGTLASIPRRLDRPMIGRDVELRQIEQAFTDVAENGRCQVLTILGAAGIGKSRIAREFSDAIRSSTTLLTSRCPSYGEGITLWPLIDIIRQATGGASRETVLRLLHGEDRDIVAERIVSTAAGSEELSDFHETFWAFKRFLECIAVRRPLCLVIDDLHWGAPSFLDFLEYVADWSRKVPLFILCLARPDLLDDRASRSTII